MKRTKDKEGMTIDRFVAHLDEIFKSARKHRLYDRISDMNYAAHYTIKAAGYFPEGKARELLLCSGLGVIEMQLSASLQKKQDNLKRKEVNALLERKQNFESEEAIEVMRIRKEVEKKLVPKLENHPCKEEPGEFILGQSQTYSNRIYTSCNTTDLYM